jgi:hypothetical protein
MAVDVDVHPDPRVQRVLEQLREAEILQGVDRVRPALHERTIIVMNALVLDMTYDRVMTHDELRLGGDRIDQAWARAGVLPERPADLRQAFPDLFGSPDTAERALTKSKEDISHRAGSDVWDAPEYNYRRLTQRGRPARVRIAPWVANPRATLEDLVGPIREFAVLHRDVGEQQSLQGPAEHAAREPTSLAREWTADEAAEPAR